MLGTGTPITDPARSGPALAIVVHGAAYLVDAGPGIVRRAAAAQRAGVVALAQPNLKIVFITHLHSDHTLGLPDLMLSPWVMERAAPLEVYGPAGTAAMTDHLEQAYAEDIRIRTTGAQPHTDSGYVVHAHDSDAVVRACGGCDVLVHEVYSAEALAVRSPDWQRYHRAAHTSGEELGALAARARPALLILTHGLPWSSTPDEIVREVRRGFGGAV